MKYLFNFESKGRPALFNRERLLLAALQKAEQLYYMLDTQYEGLYQAEAAERKKQYGPNAYKHLRDSTKFNGEGERKRKIEAAFSCLYTQQIAVFRRGLHFYTEYSVENLVPGDVVFITKGDIVPADLRIIFSKELKVNQEIYTGKNEPVLKGSSYRTEDARFDRLIDLPDICFVGTKVEEGLARGVVVNTGLSTYLYHLLFM